jgi:hypothetical protein
MYSEINYKKKNMGEDFTLAIMMGEIIELKNGKPYTLKDGNNYVNQWVFLAQKTMIDGDIVTYNKRSIFKIQYKETDGNMDKINFSHYPKWDFNVGDKVLIIYELKPSKYKKYADKDDDKIYSEINVLYAKNFTQNVEFSKNLQRELAIKVDSMIKNVLSDI